MVSHIIVLHEVVKKYIFVKIHRRNPNVNHGLWVTMMCQVNYSKCNTLVGHVDSKRGCTCVKGGRDMWELSYFPLNAKKLKLLWKVKSSRPEYWSGQPFPSPGDLPNPGIKPGSPALQADSLPAELPGKPSWRRKQGLSQGAGGKKALRRIRCNQEWLTRLTLWKHLSIKESSKTRGRQKGEEMISRV